MQPRPHFSLTLRRSSGMLFLEGLWVKRMVPERTTFQAALGQVRQVFARGAEGVLARQGAGASGLAFVARWQYGRKALCVLSGEAPTIGTSAGSRSCTRTCPRTRRDQNARSSLQRLAQRLWTAGAIIAGTLSILRQHLTRSFPHRLGWLAELHQALCTCEPHRGPKLLKTLLAQCM